MPPPDLIYAKDLTPKQKFQVLDSSKVNFYDTIYTCTNIKGGNGFTQVNCTFDIKHLDESFTSQTWFDGKTKVQIVNSKN